MKKVAIAIAGGIVLAGLAVAGPASAHTPQASIDCTSANVSLVSYDAGAKATITVDGQMILSDATFGGRYVKTFPLSGNVEHSLTVHVVSNDGAQYNYNFEKTTVGCFTPPVDTQESVVSDHVCNADGTATDTLTTTTYRQDWDVTTGAFGDKYVTATTSTSIGGDPAGCEVVIVPPPVTQEPPTTTKVSPPVLPELAETGPADDALALKLGLLALALLSGGLALFGVRFIKRPTV